MRILLVNYEYPPLGGGGGVAMRDIAVELARRHEVEVLTSAGPGLPAEEVVDGVRLCRAPVWNRDARSHASFASMITFWPIGVRHAAKALAGRRYDVVNTWFAVPSGPTGAWAAERFGAPHALTLAGGDVYDPSKWYTPDKNPVLGYIVRRVMGSADAVVAVSTDLAKRAREIYNPNKEIEVISLGMRPPPPDPTPGPMAEAAAEARAAARAALGLDRGRVYLVTMGRLVKRKNLAGLLDAMASLKDPNLALLVVGDGPERGALEAQAEALGLAGAVRFEGFVDEARKRSLLRAADVFVLPSLHEAFGLVYLEGMHAGLPVVATRPGGQEDYLADGETGHLVPQGEPAALAGALSKLVADPAARTRMGAKAKAVAAGFTVEAAARHYEALFERMVKGASRR